MAYSIREHGDPLERAYAGMIEQHLPNYALVWSEFIGNDGTAHLPLRGTQTPDIVKKRQILAQRIYTCLESCVSCTRIRDRLSETLTAPAALTLTVYLDALSDVIGLYAHIGRTRDIMIAMGLPRANPKLFSEWEDLYQQRNNVLHETKPPVSLDGGVLAIVGPEGKDNCKSLWGGSRLWTEAKNFTFTSIPALATNQCEHLLSLVDRSLAALRAEVLYVDLPGVPQQLQSAIPDHVVREATSSSGTGLEFGFLDHPGVPGSGSVDRD